MSKMTGIIAKSRHFISLKSLISIGNSMICSDIWHKYDK